MESTLRSSKILNFMLDGNWEKEVIAAFCIMLKKGVMHLMKPLQNTNW